MNTQRLRRRPLVAVAAATMVTVVTACGSGGGGQATPSAHGASSSSTASNVQLTPVAQIRLAGMAGNYGFPTPYASLRGPGKILAAQVFDQLVWPDGTGTMQPWLAKSWTHSADGLTWTFTLRSGVTFQDGSPLTADDVVFSYNYVMKGGAGATAAAAPPLISAVSSPAPNTVVLTLSKPDPILLDEIGGFGGVSIVPKKIWASVTDPVKFRGPSSLIGSGPYKLSSYDLTAGSFMFVANPDFFLGAPIVQKVVYLPTGTTDPLLLLEQGEIDVASTNLVTQSRLDGLKAKFTFLSAPGEQGTHLYFNLSKGFPYSSVSFRQAVAYAINRKDLVNRLMLGHGDPGSVGGLGPANPWLDKNLPAYSFDLVKARALLDSIGLKDTDGNGVRNLPNGGGDLHIPLLTSSADITATQLVAEYLRAAGLQADVQSIDQASMDLSGAKGTYTVAIMHFGGLSADPTGSTGLCGRVTPTHRAVASFSVTQGYNNSTVNDLCTRIATMTDMTQRAGLINQLQSIVNQEVPMMPLALGDQMAFVDSKVFKAFAYTPACPPCGVSNNKLILVTGKTLVGG